MIRTHFPSTDCDTAEAITGGFPLRFRSIDAKPHLGGTCLASDSVHREVDTQKLGDQRLDSIAEPLLIVPSAIMPLWNAPERNVLINHQHPDTPRRSSGSFSVWRELNGLRILVVEDGGGHGGHAEALRLLLQGLGADVLVSADGMRALREQPGDGRRPQEQLGGQLAASLWHPRGRLTPAYATHMLR